MLVSSLLTEERQGVDWLYPG